MLELSKCIEGDLFLLGVQYQLQQCQVWMEDFHARQDGVMEFAQWSVVILVLCEEGPVMKKGKRKKQSLGWHFQ